MDCSFDFAMYFLLGEFYNKDDKLQNIANGFFTLYSKKEIKIKRKLYCFNVLHKLLIMYYIIF